MNYSTIFIILGAVFWIKGVNVSGAETRHDGNDHPVLAIYLKSKGSGQKKITSDRIQSIRISSDNAITIVCTTKGVHVWDGQIDQGKFLVGTNEVQRNSTGYFSSSLSLRLREFPIQDSAIGFTQNYIKCLELDKEKRTRTTCIYLNEEQDRNSNQLVNENEKRGTFSVSLYSCPGITVEEENEFSGGEIPVTANIPEWLWKTDNNSVLCQVDNPSRMKLTSVDCDHPSSCNLRRYCTVKTCPSLVVTVPPCENPCNRQSMTVNFFSGQLRCEANGFTTNLNFAKGFDYEMCYFKPSQGGSSCQVLELEMPDPDTDIFHGQPLKLSGIASKFFIMRKPEVHIILSTGQVIKPTVQIATEMEYHKTFPYFVFMINSTANSNTELIKVIGHRYDSSELVVIEKQLNVKVGVPPEITELPLEWKLKKGAPLIGLPFTVVGAPDPELVLSFNGVVVGKSDPRFGLVMNLKGQKMIKINAMDGRFFGPLKISASNIFGQHDFTIEIIGTTRMTQAQAYGIATVVALLMFWGSYFLLKGFVELYDRFHRPAPVPVKNRIKIT